MTGTLEQNESICFIHLSKVVMGTGARRFSECSTQFLCSGSAGRDDKYNDTGEKPV